MKAMQTEHFWALAQHLQRCNHAIYIDSFDTGAVFIRLSTGDTLHHDHDSQPANMHSVRLALLELEARKLHRFEIRTEDKCPPILLHLPSG